MSARRQNICAHTQHRPDVSEGGGENHHMHTPGDDTDKYLLSCSIYKFLPLSCERSCLHALPCHPSCLNPPFVPHLLSSNMNPREPVWECGDLWRLASQPGRQPTGVTGLPRNLLTGQTQLTRCLNVSPVKPPCGCCHRMNLASHTHVRRHEQAHSGKTQPRVRAPCPAEAARGQAFVGKKGPRGGQRASQTHGGLWPFVFLMALSQFIIDFNSAMCHAGGKRGFYDATTARTAGCGRSPRNGGWSRWEKQSTFFAPRPRQNIMLRRYFPFNMTPSAVLHLSSFLTNMLTTTGYWFRTKLSLPSIGLCSCSHFCYSRI